MTPFTTVSHSPTTNLCLLWRNFLNSWEFLFLINYLSTVRKEVQNLKRLTKHYTYNNLMSQLIGKQGGCQRFLIQVLVWESSWLLELLGLTSFWRNCGSSHLWDGFVSKPWPTHRCKHCQNLHVSQSSAYFVRRYPTFLSLSHYEEKRDSHVLHSSLGKMVYFASSQSVLKNE